MDVCISRGILYPKIGSNITNTIQQIDVGPYFKIMRSVSRTTTTFGETNLLTMEVDRIINSLVNMYVVELHSHELLAIKYCALPTHKH